MRGVRGAVVLLALVGLCVFLAGGVVSSLGPAPAPPPPRITANPATVEPPRITVFAGPELGDFNEALDRPPFSRSRRPAAAPAIPVASPETLNATLSGVIFSTEDRVAILTGDDDGEAVRMREGDVYLGWTLVEVGIDEVLMERDGRRQRLGLTFKGAPAPPREPEPRNRRERRERRLQQLQDQEQEPEQEQEQPKE